MNKNTQKHIEFINKFNFSRSDNYNIFPQKRIFDLHIDITCNYIFTCKRQSMKNTCMLRNRIKN